MPSRGRLPVAALAVGIAALSLPASAMAAKSRTYEVTIENLTAGQPLTPPVVATHRGKDQLFRVGQPASEGVREIAENGNNGPLLASLGANSSGRISEAKQAGGGPLVPAGTPGAAEFPDHVTFSIGAERGARRLSFVSMLVCTNDGFSGVNGLKLPGAVGHSVIARSAGYDAGTEINTEDFADIVPPCQGLIGVTSSDPGTGSSNPALAEGAVISHHAGILGGADLVPAVHGWDTGAPVARITVTATG